MHAPGSLPVSIGYDLDGRPIVTARRAPASTVTSYGPDGMIASITDPYRAPPSSRDGGVA
ncbi:MAG: hypothetical protein IPG04_32720 [Polyangiaceae bacterium]|nr:hypothetical protein [Polyangiaceae bacterium]